MKPISPYCSIFRRKKCDEDSARVWLFIKEVVRWNDGQAAKNVPRYDAPIVPAKKIEAVQAALIARLQKVTIGDLALIGVRMGALVGVDQRNDVSSQGALAAKLWLLFMVARANYEVVGCDI